MFSFHSHLFIIFILKKNFYFSPKQITTTISTTKPVFCNRVYSNLINLAHINILFFFFRSIKIIKKSTEIIFFYCKYLSMNHRRVLLNKYTEYYPTKRATKNNNLHITVLYMYRKKKKQRSNKRRKEIYAAGVERKKVTEISFLFLSCMCIVCNK